MSISSTHWILQKIVFKKKKTFPCLTICLMSLRHIAVLIRLNWLSPIHSFFLFSSIFFSRQFKSEFWNFLNVLSSYERVLFQSYLKYLYDKIQPSLFRDEENSTCRIKSDSENSQFNNFHFRAIQVIDHGF